MNLKDYINILLFLLRVYKLRKIYYGFNNITVSRFLAFHHIALNEIRQFENNIRMLKHYTNIISLDNFVERKFKKNSINTVITFDDGDKSWIDIVLPILKSYGIKATFFISSGRIMEEKCASIGRSDTENNLIKSRYNNYLTIKDIIRIKQEGHIIGGHTINHISLIKERDMSIIKSEIVKDKYRLEEIIGSKIEYFAYPFGQINYNIKIRKIFEDCGYRAAVTLLPGFNSELSNMYLLHRDLVNGGMNSLIFMSISVGNRDILLFLKKLLYIEISEKDIDYLINIK